MKVTFLHLVFSTIFLAAADPSNGSVAGSVLDSTSKAIPGVVRVFLSQALPPDAVRHAAPPVQTSPQVTSRLVDSAGNFKIATLAPGSYVACASTATPGYLDPCHWAASAPTFTITAGQPIVGVKIVLAKGAVVVHNATLLTQKRKVPTAEV